MLSPTGHGNTEEYDIVRRKVASNLHTAYIDLVANLR